VGTLGRGVIIGALAGLILVPASASAVIVGRVTLDSRNQSNLAGTTDSGFPVSSRSGRFVAFWTSADNLVTTPEGFGLGIVLRDRRLATIVAVTVNRLGGPSNGDGVPLGVTPKGRFVLFMSNAHDLVRRPTPAHASELYLRNTIAGTTRLVSAAADGAPANGAGATAGALSDDAHTVCFESRATNLVAGWARGTQVYCKNLISGRVRRLGAGRRHVPPAQGVVAGSISMSGDARYVAVASASDNLLPGGASGRPQAFVFDRAKRRILRANETAGGRIVRGDSYNGIMHPRIDAAGNRIVMWGAEGRELVKTLPFGRLQVTGHSDMGDAALMPRGDRLAYTRRIDGIEEVVLVDLATMRRKVVSITADGTPGNQASSIVSTGEDGTVTFQSLATDLPGAPIAPLPVMEVYFWEP
jgi:hypothetical protein